MTGTLDAVTLGEAMVLHLAEPGVPLAAATSLRRSIAGAESNVAIGLARLGHEVGWIGRVGSDVAGDLVLNTLRASGVDVSRAVRDPERTTGLLVRDCRPDRPIEVAYYRRDSAGSQLAAADIDRDYVASARVIHLSGITPVLSDRARSAVETVLEAAAAGATVVFDPNIRRKLCSVERAVAMLRPLAARAAVIIAGEDEARLLSGREAREASAAWFLEAGAELVVLKNGAQGAWATDGANTWQQPALPTHVVDPVGAGDAFAAGLISGLLRRVPIPQALREAATIAALVVGTAGDIEGLPTPEVRDAAVGGSASVNR